MSAATGTNTRRLFGQDVERRRSEPLRSASADAGAGLDHQQLADVGEPEDDQAHAQGHDQRVDAEDADADAVQEADQRRRDERRRRSRRPAPGSLTSVAITNAAIEATAPTDRSMPPVSIASVWQAARIASGTAARDDRAGPPGCAITPGAASSDTTTSTAEQADQRDDRPVAEQAAPAGRGSATGSGIARSAAARSCPAPPHLDEAADHDDADEDDALDHGREVRVDAEEGQVGPDQLAG